MLFKVGLLVLGLLAGSHAFPHPEQEVSLFDHTDANARIVGGTVAGRVPHMVALSSGLMITNLLCGGSIISQRAVLTAAHCIVPVSTGSGLISSLRGVVGSNRWNSGGTRITFSRGINHPNYQPLPILKNDIGILIASSNIALSDTVGIVGINRNFIEGDAPTSVNGWGRTRAGGSISANLLHLDAQTIDGEHCVSFVAQRVQELNFRGAPTVDPNLEICTYHSPNFGTCNGDSGSALLLRADGTQIGIVSWGLPCARGAPDMFTRVSAHSDWINQNM